MTSSHKIVINASQEIVWKLLTDINSWSKWNSAITSAHLDGEFAPNSVFKWKSGGFNIVSTLQEVTPQSHFGWAGKAFGTRAVHTWTLTPQDNGVLVQTEESFEGWLVSLMKGSMQKTLDSALKVWLENLKKKAENSN